MQNEKTLNDEAALVMERLFEHPVKDVFEAFSSGEALAQWWAPASMKCTSHRFDFRPGGLFLFKMQNKELTMWARFIFGRIDPGRHLEFTLSFSDEKGGITRAPFFENWPLEIFNVFTFENKGDSTVLKMKSYPVNATNEEIASFRKNWANFNSGVSASFDELETYLISTAN